MRDPAMRDPAMRDPAMRDPVDIDISSNSINIINNLGDTYNPNIPANFIRASPESESDRVSRLKQTPSKKDSMDRDINQDYYLKKLKNDNNISIENNPTDKQFYTLKYILDKTTPNDTNSKNLKDIQTTLNKQVKAANSYKCPMMVDSPWSDFRSGDDIPEPYNI